MGLLVLLLLNKVNAFINLLQFFEYAEEAEWAVEVMKSTGKPTAITMCIGPTGDTNRVPTGECAVRLARKGRFFNCRNVKFATLGPQAGSCRV